MKKSTKDVFCVIGIIILGIMIIFATFIKYVADKKGEKENNIIQDEENNKDSNIEEDETTEIVENLFCTLVYYDEENSKANVKEEITVKFDEDEAPINQEYIKTYTFENDTDYQAFISSYKDNDNETMNEDSEDKTVTIKSSSDYSTPYKSEDKMDFRNSTYTQIKENLTSKEYTCN